ncbi:MAG: chemotaxis protein CheW [Clostridiales bacterium]|nr:chemotaxis protein CheW [Clostridiales bacterium]HBM81532.1 chemotaxis protein CheW [Clostridiaceae bacterium]
MQIVVFYVGNEKYAIDTSHVQIINKMTDITCVPCAPSYIKGLINLRGNIITVYDPYFILGVNEAAPKPENILIVETEDETIGVTVDGVADVVDISEDEIKDISVKDSDEKKYIKGTINIKDYLVTLIDPDEFVNANK